MAQGMLDGLINVFTVDHILVMCIGVVAGIFAGAMPGLSAVTGIVILLPFTHRMDAATALIMLAACYCGAMYGGSISAILMNTPGTASAAMTALDGYEMARQGKGKEALEVAAFASWFGGTLSVICALIFAKPLSKIAVRFGAPEYFLLALLGLTILISLSKSDPVKGMISSVIGLLLGTVGLDIFDNTRRFTFGTITLLSGIPSVPLMIGFFSIPAVFRMVKNFDTKIQTVGIETKEHTFHFLKPRLVPGLIRASLIGVLIGVLPGVGGNIASFLAYDTEKKLSKHAERFGTGIIDGVAVSEASNNGVTGGSIVTMLTLGIPGSPATVVMLGVLMMRGITPGRAFFETADGTAYTFLMSLFPANLVMLLIGIWGAKYFAKAVKIPPQMLLSVILVICTVGAYTVNNRIFDVYLLFGLGIFAYLMSMCDIGAMPAVLGFLLGPYAEKGIRQTTIISGVDYTIFFRRPICVVLIVLIVFSVIFPFVGERIAGKAKIERIK